ncbi:hypothetical protein ACDB75_000938 [Salmonella enterica]
MKSNTCNELIIYGDAWPEVTALWAGCNEITQKKLFKCHDESTLNLLLCENPDAGIVLFIRPHERILFLCRMVAKFNSRPLFFAVRECCYPVDIWVVKLICGNVPIHTCDIDLILSLSKKHHKMNPFYALMNAPKIPNYFYCKIQSRTIKRICNSERVAEDAVIHIMNELIFILMQKSFSSHQIKAIKCLWESDSLSVASKKSGIPLNNLSYHYLKVLRKLNLRKHVISRHRGVLLRDELQHDRIY